MDMRTFQVEFSRLAAALGVEVPPARSQVYWEDLRDLPDEAFVAACRRARQEWRKPDSLPPIAVLLGYAREAAVQRGDALDGEAAWRQLVARTLRHYRPGVANQTLDWPDERARTIVREHLGGIYAVATTEGEYAIDQLRRRFVALYDRSGAVEAADKPALPAPDRLRLVSGE